jgi:YHS domain-containing protein
VSDNHPERVLDPVCGMTVDVDRAEAEGLTADHDGRRFAFCRSGCMRAFLEDPATYASAATTPAVIDAERGLPVIDEGMRRWYDACSCCLSEAYPDIKTALDAERAAGAPTATNEPSAATEVHAS